MLELIFEVLGELVLQIFVEVMVELGLHSASEPLRKRPNPWVAAFGYAILGAIAGGVSLVFLPDSLAFGDAMRKANLVFTPLLAGGAMMALGAWRVKRGQPTLRIDRFAYGYVFALAMALVRFQFAG